MELRSSQVQNAVERFCSALAESTGVNVVFNKHSQAFATATMISLPQISDDKPTANELKLFPEWQGLDAENLMVSRFRVVRAMSVHEVGHIRHQCKAHAHFGKMQGLPHLAANILLDIRDERLICREFAGARDYLRDAYSSPTSWEMCKSSIVMRMLLYDNRGDVLDKMGLTIPKDYKDLMDGIEDCKDAELIERINKLIELLKRDAYTPPPEEGDEEDDSSGGKSNKKSKNKSGKGGQSDPNGEESDSSDGDGEEKDADGDQEGEGSREEEGSENGEKGDEEDGDTDGTGGGDDSDNADDESDAERDDNLVTAGDGSLKTPKEKEEKALRDLEAIEELMRVARIQEVDSTINSSNQYRNPYQIRLAVYSKNTYPPTPQSGELKAMFELLKTRQGNPHPYRTGQIAPHLLSNYRTTGRIFQHRVRQNKIGNFHYIIDVSGSTKKQRWIYAEVLVSLFRAVPPKHLVLFGSHAMEIPWRTYEDEIYSRLKDGNGHTFGVDDSDTFLMSGMEIIDRKVEASDMVIIVTDGGTHAREVCSQTIDRWERMGVHTIVVGIGVAPAVLPGRVKVNIREPQDLPNVLRGVLTQLIDA